MKNENTVKKIAWVTGASSGIGLATAKKLMADGWYVAISARSEDTLKKIEAENEYIFAYPADITKADVIEKTIKKIEKDLGPIDMAVLSAGTYFRDGLDDFSAQTFKKQYEVNVFGTMNCVEPLLNLFKKRKKGHLAMIASVAGYRGLPHALSYGSSKAALNNFAESLATHCIGTDIKIQIVNPGFIDTPLTKKNKFPMPMLMNVDEAAEKLVQGLKSNKFEITFPWLFAFILKVIGLLPDKLYIRLASKAQEKA